MITVKLHFLKPNIGSLKMGTYTDFMSIYIYKLRNIF